MGVPLFRVVMIDIVALGKYFLTACPVLSVRRVGQLRVFLERGGDIFALPQELA